MPTITTSFTISVGANSETARTTTTNQQAIETDVDLAAAEADTEVALPFLITDLATGELWFISSGKEITVKTNSSGGDDTFVVPAGGAIPVKALTENIVSVFVTNEDADIATALKIRGVRDATP